MKPLPPGEAPRLSGQPCDEASPGVPGFRTWRGIYLFVFGCFVTYVALLTVFSWFFA